MRGRGVVLAVLAVVLAVLIGTQAYQAGYGRGVIEGARTAAMSQGAPATPGTPGAGPAPAPMVPYPVYGYPYPYHGPFFGFFGFFWGLLLIFLFFALLRGLFWGRGWRHHHGMWGKGVPQTFEEWHRQAHEKPTGTAV